MKQRIADGTVITVVGSRPVVLHHHDVCIEDGVIFAVEPHEQAAERTGHFDEIIDAADYLVIPGLVNTHHHLFQSLTRGLKSAQNVPLFDWLTVLYQKWRRLDYESVRAAASVSIAELLLSGCTTTSDHYYVFPRSGDTSIEPVADAAEELGIRIHICRGSMSVGRSRGGLPPDDCVEDEAHILNDCRRVIAEFHDPAPHAMRRIDLAPCSPFSISPELLDETRDLARAYKVLLHTHAAETLDEEKYCLEKFKRRPIQFLHDHGWLGSDVYLAHCVHVDDEDVALLADTRTGVVHCPCSNMRLGSGIAPIRALLAAKVRVGLGVDGSSSNDGGNVLAEVRQAMLLQRVWSGASAMSPAEAFTIATTGGAACLHRPELGKVEPGCSADLAMYRADDVALAGAVEHDPLGALMLCIPPRPDRVIVNGRTVVNEGRLVTVDQQKLARQLNEIVRNKFRD